MDPEIIEAPEAPEASAIPEAEVEQTEVVADSAALDETPDDSGDVQKGKKPHWASKRIDELTREKYDRAREADYWRQQALQNAPKPEPVKAPEPVAIPSLESVGYDEAKYQAALLEYVQKQSEAVVERRLTEVEQKRTQQARIETFATRQQEFAKATPDFESKVMRDPTLPITEAMRDVILDSPAGPEVAYYLANNRETAQQIAALPAHLAALEMGRIEGRLAYEKQVKTRPTPVVTKAPPPPPVIDDSGAPSLSVKASTGESDKLSDEEWMRLREKELKRKKA